MKWLLPLLGVLICGCQDYRGLGVPTQGAPDDGGWDADGFNPGDPGSDPGSDPGGDPGGDPGPQECPPYAGALMDCAYRLTRDPADGCVRAECLADICHRDDDCPPADGLEAGGYCVAGNCVFCRDSRDCERPLSCRAGRCVERSEDCRARSECAWSEDCRTVMLSEMYCPVCICDSLYQYFCSHEANCISTISRLELCVYGRCVECINDDDCDGGECLPPGMCYQTWPHPSALYGTWLIGWPGGLNHYSYFRFEPDGTLRRGAYPAQEPWSDDVPTFPCIPDQPPPIPYLGAWEPIMTDSGLLAVRMLLNTPCDPGAGWSARYVVELAADGNSASFVHIDGDQNYEAMRVPTDTCTPDFASCRAP